MKKLFLLSAIAAMTFIYACGGDAENATDDTAAVTEDSAVSEEVIKEDIPAETDGAELSAFIQAPEYGWKDAERDFFLSFLSEGRLSIQGADGEATMWEGTWSLNGDSLTMVHPEEGAVTQKATAEGEDLVIGGRKFIVYKTDM